MKLNDERVQKSLEKKWHFEKLYWWGGELYSIAAVSSELGSGRLGCLGLVADADWLAFKIPNPTYNSYPHAHPPTPLPYSRPNHAVELTDMQHLASPSAKAPKITQPNLRHTHRMILLLYVKHIYKAQLSKMLIKKKYLQIRKNLNLAILLFIIAFLA